MAAVHVIAPHLFSKRLSSRRRLPLSSLNKSFMATTGNESDPELSDDTRSLQLATQDKADASIQRSMIKKIGKDGHGDYVLRRVSGRTDASDSGSSWSGGSRPVGETIDWKQLLKDAEERAEQRRLSDLEAAEKRRLSDLKAAEERAEQRRLSDLKAAEEREERAEQRRLSDLEAAEKRLQEAEERAEKRLREAEDRAEKRLREAEDRTERLHLSVLGQITPTQSARP